MEVINTIGRRKTAVARIYMQSGNGNITVNGRDYKEYFASEVLQTIIHQPLAVVNELGKYDIKANLDGGGCFGASRGFTFGSRPCIARSKCREPRSSEKRRLPHS